MQFNELNAQNDAAYKANLLVIEQYKAETARLKEQNKEPSTLIERQQVALNEPASVSAFSDGTLEGEDLDTYVTTLQSYIKPSKDITGTTSQNTIPPSVAGGFDESVRKKVLILLALIQHYSQINPHQVQI